jgi:hypothetical protein
MTARAVTTREADMARYMLLLHRDRDRPAPSREGMMEIIRRYTAWGDALQAKGKVVGREKLAPVGRGRFIRLHDGEPLVTDGPYAEVRDVIGGYYLIEAEDDAEAEAIARDCPHLWGTNWVELRPIDTTSVAEAQAQVGARSMSDVDSERARPSVR